MDACASSRSLGQHRNSAHARGVRPQGPAKYGGLGGLCCPKLMQTAAALHGAVNGVPLMQEHVSGFVKPRRRTAGRRGRRVPQQRRPQLSRPQKRECEQQGLPLWFRQLSLPRLTCACTFCHCSERLGPRSLQRFRLRTHAQRDRQFSLRARWMRRARCQLLKLMVRVVPQGLHRRGVEENPCSAAPSTVHRQLHSPMHSCCVPACSGGALAAGHAG